MKNKIEKAFTLIELLVVIAIIGILAGILFVAINPKEQSDKAKDVKRISDIQQIQKALDMYQLEHGYYPKIGWNISHESSWTELENKLKDYLPNLPKDPDNESGNPWNGYFSYGYYARNYSGGGKWYMLVYNLREDHPDLEATDGVTACDGHYFHYGTHTTGSRKNTITVGRSCN